MKAGDPGYQRLEESLVNEQAMMKGQAALKNKEFMQKEARLYFNAYHEITDDVNYFCQKNGIVLVLNFSGDSIHEENPDDVARGITNKVVYYNKSLDITGYIVPRFQKDPRAADNSPMGVQQYPAH